VVLWSDSVNNAYRPELLQTTVKLLGRSGYCVYLAKDNFCCGRPLYEHGFIDKAKQQLDNILSNFHSQLPATMTIAEFLLSKGITPVRKLPKAVMHLHCHGKNTITAERSWLQQCFEEIVEPENGCCGMAGVYGLRKSTAATGDILYSRKLRNVVDEADTDTKIISDGYSCRKQIEDNSTARVWHPVEIMDACMTDSV